MVAQKTPAHGVSPIDRAHGLRLAAQLEPALRLSCAVVAESPADVAAWYLLSRLLIEAKRTVAVAKTLPELLQRFIRRGDLGGACLCALLVEQAGGDRSNALAEIASAFGAGSARVSDAPALPPPLPVTAEVSPELAALSGEPLLLAAERALAKCAATPDPVPSDAPLPRLPLFGVLAPPVLAKLLGAFVLREFATAKTVVKQGEDGREAFLLVRGVLNVLRESAEGQPTLLAVLGPGAVFGEMALVSRTPRAASVVAVEPAAVLCAQRAQLELLAQKDPTIGRELGRFCQRRMVANLVRHSRILSAVEPAKRHQLIARFSTHTFQPGEMLVSQGEEGGSLFLIASGLVEVRQLEPDGERMVLAQFGAGEVVGEISLVLRRPATADVIAVQPTVALELTWAEFHEAIRDYPGLLQQLYEVATQREQETRSVVAREALDVSDSVLL
jgi:cAMP-dependent protein kinase regulator